MTATFTGPFEIGRMPNSETAEENAGRIFRHNDGSLVIQGREREFPDDRTPVLLVPMFARAKRGEAWRTDDPEQEAFAAHVVKLLNLNLSDERF